MLKFFFGLNDSVLSCFGSLFTFNSTSGSMCCKFLFKNSLFSHSFYLGMFILQLTWKLMYIDHISHLKYECILPANSNIELKEKNLFSDWGVPDCTPSKKFLYSKKSNLESIMRMRKGYTKVLS